MTSPLDVTSLYSGILNPGSGGMVGGASLSPLNIGSGFVGGVLPQSTSGGSAPGQDFFGNVVSAENGKSPLQRVGDLLGIGSILANDATGNTAAADQIAQSGSAPTDAATSSLFDAFGGSIARITIIVLGFIFVAVGLSMFKPAQQIVQAVKS